MYNVSTACLLTTFSVAPSVQMMSTSAIVRASQNHVFGACQEGENIKPTQSPRPVHSINHPCADLQLSVCR